MKKMLIVLLSAMFVLSGLTFVFADDGGQDSVRSRKAGASVEIGGDARVRGTWKNNYALDSDADADTRIFDSRVRLYITGKSGNGIEARTKMTVSSGTWDEENLGFPQNTAGTVNANFAYLHIPIGSFNIDAGLMERSFGNKFHNDYTSEARDTLNISTNLGDTGVGVFIDKISESTATGDENLEDNDNWGLYVNHSTGNIEAGALLVYENYKNMGADVDDETGTEFVVYVNADVGSIGIAAELAYTAGDLNTTTVDEENPMGGFISASMPMGQMAVSGTIAYAANNYSADSHFTPTVFIGTDNLTAIADFGADLGTGTRDEDDGAFSVVASVDYDVNDDMGVSGTVAYHSFAGQSGKTVGDDASAFELDAGMTYKLADNASYGLVFGYFAPSDLTSEDDAAIAVAHNVSIFF